MNISQLPNYIQQNSFSDEKNKYLHKSLSKNPFFLDHKA